MRVCGAASSLAKPYLIAQKHAQQWLMRINRKTCDETFSLACPCACLIGPGFTGFASLTHSVPLLNHTQRNNFMGVNDILKLIVVHHLTLRFCCLHELEGLKLQSRKARRWRRALRLEHRPDYQN